MANHSITDFISKFGGGTRINRFHVTGKLGESTVLDDNGGTFHIRAASLPASQIGGIPINYRGRTVVYPGDRVYAPWQITVIDENPKSTQTGKTLYKAFHDWSNQINNHRVNTSTQTNPSRHFSDQSSNAASTWSIKQLDTNGTTVIREFKLYNCWPMVVGAIELDMSQDNVLASFSVVLAYSHFDYVLSN